MIIQTKGDVVKLTGSLVENQWPALQSAVSLLLEEHPGGVIIDGSGLTDVSDAGVRTFLDASHFIQAHSARVIVSGLSEAILEAVKNVPGVRSQLVTAATVEQARASLEYGGAVIVPDARTRPVVLVPLIGAWQRAIDYAAAEASARRADAHLLYVLKVPRNLPLGAPMPAEEHEAQRALDEAEKAMKRKGVTVRRRTTRARDLVEGAGKFAAETKADLLVVCYYKEDLMQEGSRYADVGALCHEAHCDIVVCCVNK